MKVTQETCSSVWQSPFLWLPDSTHEESSPDPCSADFGRETPKFRFEFWCGFSGGFFPPVPSTAKLRIWTLRIWGFRGPGFHSARQVFCGDASRLFLDHFSKQLSSVLGQTELCHEVQNPGPQNPKSSTIKTTTLHYSAVFPRKTTQKIQPNSSRKIHPGICPEEFPSDFCGSLLLTERAAHRLLAKEIGKNARFKIENARSETRVSKTQRCVYYSLVLGSVLGCVLRTRVPKIHS